MSTGILHGDGNQASHWKDNALTGNLIGIMDPTLSFGQAYPITDADFRSMDLMGYDIAFNNVPTVPAPGTLALILGGAMVGWIGLRGATAVFGIWGVNFPS